MTTTHSAPARVLAPDIARGLMLLLIALANMPWHLSSYETDGLSMHDPNGGVLDRAWQAVAIIAIDGRSYPLFAFLFGYGIWQLYRRQVSAGASREEARRLLRRRHWWMLAFGAVHALLLWGGDIIGAYGLVGLLACWLFLDRSDRTLAIWAGALTGLLVVGAVSSWIGGAALGLAGDAGGSVSVPTAAESDTFLHSVPIRLATWATVLLGQGLLTLAVPVAVLLALLAARHSVLERADEHRRLLTATALVGVGIGWAGGAVAFAHFVGALPDLPSWTFQMLSIATGLAGGIGYAAAFGLIGVAWQRRGVGVVGRALVATGKRSMTSYLLQSVLFVPVLSIWGLGLGGVLTEWQGALYAVGVWLTTVLIATAMERRGQRGPFERLLRHLAYPKSVPSKASS
ncbi:DUF418 domain-containing protein [Pseudoclavibacter sp. RFBA6]|uniref:DUF418 domain-containing protein n=1 Tax=Pseudoclavibacter sp. RFBA6 TaxID=2080573 RepID=UPI000CE88445|nr:DUF418 domain-containing protein [Pseudoclavibacter sp. RFBA6]PPG38378.1 hypothetical protein C5C17_15640 [Pseudoclavibacter sp. RFBA6]